MIHEHSIAAHRSERPKLCKRAEAVWRWLEEHGPATDRQVQIGLGYSEPGAVRPRLTELLILGMLVEVDSVKCSLTQKTVRRTDIRRGPPQQTQLFS